MDYSSLGKRVKEKRKSMNLSQEELSKKSGFSRQTLSKIEQGKLGSGITLLNFIKTLEALNLELKIEEKAPFDFDL